MRLKVLFRGSPESGVPVEATYAGFSKTPEVKIETVRTDKDGIVEITIKHHGLWYITAKKYIRQIDNIQYENASYQANLIFQIQPEKPVE